MADPKKEIDYRVRPSKHVERQMICEALYRLSHFGSLREYRYIGFGARYFVDFSLFHKRLGFQDLISIEKDTDNLARYEWNRPYRCIKVKGGSSNAILPSLSWTKKVVTWLDYDGSLDDSCLIDVETFFSNARAGSVFIITVNAHVNLANASDIEALRKRVDLPAKYTNDKLSGFGLAAALREVVLDKITVTLNARNGGLSKDRQLHFSQIFNFQYTDSVRMMTLGGLLWDETQRSIVDGEPFKPLSFIRVGAEAFLIPLPMLTLREIKFLDAHLPISGGKLPAVPIPDAERDKYVEIYRYFPTYTDAEIP